MKPPNLLKNQNARNFLETNGLLGVLRLVFYPITSLYFTPYALVRTLWNSRVLFSSRPGQSYSHYNLASALNNLFYWNRYLNLKRYGRAGTSPLMGLGNATMDRNFHYSMFSLGLYRRYGAATLLSSGCLLLISHTLWYPQLEAPWFLIVMLLLLFSTGLYSNVFVLQNYNILGWVTFPVGLFALENELWYLVAGAWLIGSFGSFTVAFLTGLLALFYAIFSWDLNPLAAFIPALLRMIYQFWPFVKGWDLSQAKNLLKSLGFGAAKAKYKRTQTRKLDLPKIYYLVLYAGFFGSVLILENFIAISVLLGIIILISNSTLLRFCDEQSIYMFMILSSTAVMFAHPNPYLLIPYWLLISPLPVLTGFHLFDSQIDKVKVLSPVDVGKYLQAIESFLESVKRGERVLMVFNDPNDTYENIYDGFRILTELTHYAAVKNYNHLVPDWVAINAMNYYNAPGFWGRDIDSISGNMSRWKADYAIVYTQTPVEEEEVLKWKNSGFEMINSFNWNIFEHDFGSLKKPDIKGLKWFLIKPSRRPL